MTQPHNPPAFPQQLRELKDKAWSKAYATRPLNEICSKKITIDIVGNRCVYINDHRVVGGKPYVSENLPTDSRALTIRDVLEAFTDKQLQAFLDERKAVNSYLAGLRDFRDAMDEADQLEARVTKANAAAATESGDI